jgi:hypothetical protein
MLEGLMQHDSPLTLQLMLDRMRLLYGDRDVVSVRGGERTGRATGRSSSAPSGSAAC